MATDWPRPMSFELAGEAGLFGPDSMSWRIARENVLGGFGGARALILQVAHPLVAAGVGEHSDYRRNPWDRLFRTLDTVTAITFGTPEEAEEAAQRVWRVHGHVKGGSPDAGGRFPAGTPYSARDPELAMWVHATLLDTALLVYDRYVERLTRAEREDYYEEQKLFAEMFGVPREMQPETYGDFNAYFDRVLETELAVTDTLRDVVDATVVRPPLPFPLRPLSRPLGGAYGVLTADLLPAGLRDELGFPRGRARKRTADGVAAVVRTLLPITPKLVRDFPRARVAERRLRSAA